MAEGEGRGGREEGLHGFGLAAPTPCKDTPHRGRGRGGLLKRAEAEEGKWR